MFSCIRCVHFNDCIIYQNVSHILLNSVEHFDINKLFPVFESIGLACNKFELERRKEKIYEETSISN